MTVKTSKADPNVLQDMDEAAANAEEDLANIDDAAVKAVSEWWKKWYMQAGHKRLARILLRQLKQVS